MGYNFVSGREKCEPRREVVVELNRKVELNSEAETGSLGHWNLDPRTMELQSSDACRRNHGLHPREDSTYEEIVSSVHPDDRDRVREAVRRAFEEGEDYEEQYRVILPSGEVRNILARGRLQRPSNGGAPQLAGTTLDVTGGASTGGASGRGEQAILEAAGEGIYGLDTGGRVTFVNPAAERMIGRQAREMVGERMHGEIHHSRPDGSPYPAHECPLHDTLRDGTIRRDDEVFWRADGSSFPVSYTATPTVEDGEITGAVVTFSDVTERKRREERELFLLKLSDALRPLADPVEIQAKACRLLGEHLDVERAYYVEVNEAQGYARIGRDYLRGESPSLAGEHRTSDFGWIVPRLRRGETVVLATAEDSRVVPEADRAAMRAVGIVAHISAPLVKAGELAGALCVTESTPREWSRAEVALVRETGERIWKAVERARAEEALRDSEERLQLAVAAPGLGVFDWDLLTDRIECTEGFRKLTGASEEQLITGTWVTQNVVHPDDRGFFETWVARATVPGSSESYNFEHRTQTHDGERWVHAFGKFYFEGEGDQRRPVRVVGNILDITERKRAEAVLAESEERQAFLLELSDAIRAQPGEDAIGELCTRRLAEHLRTDRCYFARLYPEEDRVFIGPEYHRPDLRPVSADYRLSDFPEAIRKIQARTPVFDDVAGDPDMTEADKTALAAMDIGAWLGGAIRQGDEKAIWALIVASTTPRAWTRNEVALVENLAERSWAAVERARVEEALGDREERLDPATEAAELGVWELDLRTNASPVRSPRHDQIFGYEEPVEDWSFGIFLNHVHPEDRERIERSFEQALRTGLWEFECRIIRADGQERWILARGRFYYEGDERVSEPRRAVGTVQDITARKQAEAEREQARQRTAFLSEASRRLADSLDWEQTLTEIARLAVPRICDLCVVDTIDAPGEDSSVRRLAASHHEPEKERLAWELEERYPVSKDERSAIAEVIRTGRSALVTEVDDEWLDSISRDEDHRRILEGLGLGSIVIVPLLAHGRILGALTLASDGSGRRYDEEDLALAEDLARRAAQSMDNARLYAEQTHAARTLQQSLLPPSLPEIPGVEAAARFRPATSEAGADSGGYNVGGDFYDVFQTPAGWAVVVGDVMGKGVEAAELTAMVRYTLRTAAMTGETPSNVISTLNAAMLNQRSDLRFCTLAYGLLTEASGGAVRLTLCRGGHPPPIILRADGAVEEAGERGFLVGVEAGTGWSDVAVELAEGDSVIFYTDGLTEARDPGGRMFGGQRLEELAASSCRLGADGMAEALENGVLEFQRGEKTRDDVALLVIEATGRDGAG